MRFAILCLCVFLFSQEFKTQYVISHDKIISKDLFPQAPYFLIASFGEKFELSIPAKKLKELFVRYGFLVNTRLEEVQFVYALPWDAKRIKQKLSEAFKKQYSGFTFEIKTIDLKPLGEIKGKNIRLLQAQFEDKILKKHRFLLPIEVEVDSKRLVYPFLCEIDATLEAYVSTQEIRSGGDLQHITKQRIVFQDLSLTPASLKEIQNSSARSYIGKNQIIFTSKLKPKVIVKKGDLLDVVYREENLMLETRLQAMENGSLGQDIWVKNPQSKKQIKVKITGEGKAVVK